MDLWVWRKEYGGVLSTAVSARDEKVPPFSGRDSEWSEWSFILESVAAMANLEPAIEGALTR